MLKKLILVGAVVAIIPLEQEKQADLYQAAKSTVLDITGFCGRNPGVCEKGSAAIDKMATKAEFGARMMIDIAKDRVGTNGDEVTQLLKATRLQNYNRPTTPKPARSFERFPSYENKQYNNHHSTTSNTLSATDLKPGWRGNANR